MARHFASVSNQYLRSASTPISGAPFTMCAWGYLDSDVNGALIAIGDSGETDEFYCIYRWATQDNAALWRYTTGSEDYTYSTANTIPIQEWHHVCAVVTATNNVALFVDDGDKKTDVTDVGITGWDNVTIGACADSSPVPYMNGRIAEAAIWDAALTDHEVRLHYMGVPAWCIRPGNLAMHAPFRYGYTWDRDIARGLTFTPYNGPTWTPDPPQVQKMWLEHDMRLWRRLAKAPTVAAILGERGAFRGAYRGAYRGV